MRTIDRPSKFRRDFKKALANPRHSKDIDGLLIEALRCLVVDAPLPEHMRDHALAGNWNGYRECHIKPDLLLIYRQRDPDNILELTRLGSHSELFR